MTTAFYKNMEDGVNPLDAETNASVDLDTTSKLTGANSVSITSLAAGNWSAQTPNASDIDDILPSKIYTVTGLFRMATTTRDCEWSIVEFTDANAFIGVQTIAAAVSVTNAAGGTRVSFTFTTSATTGRIRIIPRAKSAAAAGEIFYVDEIRVMAGAGGTGTNPAARPGIGGPFSPGYQSWILRPKYQLSSTIRNNTITGKWRVPPWAKWIRLFAVGAGRGGIGSGNATGANGGQAGGVSWTEFPTTYLVKGHLTYQVGSGSIGTNDGTASADGDPTFVTINVAGQTIYLVYAQGGASANAGGNGRLVGAAGGIGSAQAPISGAASPGGAGAAGVFTAGGGGGGGGWQSAGSTPGQGGAGGVPTMLVGETAPVGGAANGSAGGTGGSGEHGRWELRTTPQPRRSSLVAVLGLGCGGAASGGVGGGQCGDGGEGAPGCGGGATGGTQGGINGRGGRGGDGVLFIEAWG